jgi:hypothetical protein
MKETEWTSSYVLKDVRCVLHFGNSWPLQAFWLNFQSVITTPYHPTPQKVLQHRCKWSACKHNALAFLNNIGLCMVLQLTIFLVVVSLNLIYMSPNFPSPFGIVRPLYHLSIQSLNNPLLPTIVAKWPKMQIKINEEFHPHKFCTSLVIRFRFAFYLACKL